MLIDLLQDRADLIKYVGNVSPHFYWSGDDPRLRLDDASYCFTTASYDLFLEAIHVPQSFIGRMRQANVQLSEDVVNASMPPKLHLLTSLDRIVGVFVKDRPFVPALAIHDTISEHVDVKYITMSEMDEQFYTAIYMVNDEYGVSVLYSDVFAGPPKFEAAVVYDNTYWRVQIANHKFRTIGDVLKIFDQLRYNIDEALYEAKSTQLHGGSSNLREVARAVSTSLKLPVQFPDKFEEKYMSNTEILKTLRSHNPYRTVAQKYNYDSTLCRILI